MVDTKDLKSFDFGCASSNLATHTKNKWIQIEYEDKNKKIQKFGFYSHLLQKPLSNEQIKKAVQKICKEKGCDESKVRII